MVCAGLVGLLSFPCSAQQHVGEVVHGQVVDAQGRALPGARLVLRHVRSGRVESVTSSADGSFRSKLPANGRVDVEVEATGFRVLHEEADAGTDVLIRLTPAALGETIEVTASINETTLRSPDPAQRVYVGEELLDANPGRPGAPVSIPGLPVETASGGIKAPQYFAPGVAGDHGEPIAQYIAVGDFLAPNNLSANAHGNGYADPNILIPAVLAGVRTDGGAFNVLEGNHSLNLAVAYELRPQMARFVTLTGDARDLDLVAGLSFGREQDPGWLTVEVLYGNGLLDRLEHRQQYKLNAAKQWAVGRHEVRLFGVGYYGQSFIPGLVPVGQAAVLKDTLDPRQHDQTHTALVAANDRWQLSPSEQVSLSGMFRTYNLALDSNFGDGLIRQSEFRTVAVAQASYSKTWNEQIEVMAGVDEARDAPRRLELDHYLSLDPAIYGPFAKVTENNLTINDAAPFAVVSGRLLSHLRYSLGWRQDEVRIGNTDLVNAANSFDQLANVSNPKGTVSWAPSARSLFPVVSFSMGQAFFTNDPRIGTGTGQGTLVERAHAAQLVVEKELAGSDLRLTAGRTSTDQTLAKIDADTGLQEDEGPGRLKYLTGSASHRFRFGLLQASLSKADARDVSSGLPTPEAPRTIIDALGTTNHLPWRMQARAEFEYVGHKPLGDGFEAVPVKEFRGAVVKPVPKYRLEFGVDFLVARGYTGQTTENLPAGWTPAAGLPGCPASALDCATQEMAVGVRLPSYVGGSVRYQLRSANRQ